MFCKDGIRFGVGSFQLFLAIMASRHVRMVANVCSWLFLMIAYRILHEQYLENEMKKYKHARPITDLIFLCSVDFRTRSEETNWKSGK